jgi:hypothetical protein
MRKINVTVLLAVMTLLALVIPPAIAGHGWGGKGKDTTKNEITVSWNDCPKGLVNDPYPGECKDYIDTDGDGICDHSEPPPWERNSAVSSNNPKSAVERYYIPQLLLISLLVVALGEISERKIGKRFARYWWNILLLIFASTSAIIGFLLIFVDIQTIKDFDLIFWHVEFSIVASVLCLYHIVKRYRYFFRIPR